VALLLVALLLVNGTVLTPPRPGAARGGW
jgi:hypothetical protein